MLQWIIIAILMYAIYYIAQKYEKRMDELSKLLELNREENEASKKSIDENRAKITSNKSNITKNKTAITRNKKALELLKDSSNKE